MEIPTRFSSLILTPVEADEVPSPGGNEVVILADDDTGQIILKFSDGSTFAITKGQLATSALVLTGASTVTGGTSIAFKVGSTTVATLTGALASGVVKADGSHALTAAAIVDADVAANAAIAGTKTTPVGTIQTLTNETAAYTPGAAIVKVVNTSGICTLNLPDPASNIGLKIEMFIAASPASQNVVLHRNASESIDGSAADKTISSASIRYVEILCDGTDWLTCSGNVA